jgi:predicted DNA binding protein
VSKQVLKSELLMQKNALTLALHRIDTLLQVVEQMPNDGTEFKVKTLAQSDAFTMIEDVLDKVERIPGFDKTFLESLESGLSKYGKLTDKQAEALKRLHSKFCKEHY